MISLNQCWALCPNCSYSLQNGSFPLCFILSSPPPPFLFLAWFPKQTRFLQSWYVQVCLSVQLYNFQSHQPISTGVNRGVERSEVLRPHVWVGDAASPALLSLDTRGARWENSLETQIPKSGVTPTSPKNNLPFPTGNFACIDAAEVDSLQEPFWLKPQF